MREITESASFTLPAHGSLTDALLRHAAATPDRVTMVRRTGGAWIDTTAAELLDIVRRTAKGLLAAGVRPGDRVALMSRTRHEWTIIDYAIWYAGGVTVPIYETSSLEQVEWILRDSGAMGLVVETQAHLELSLQATETVVAHRWVIDGGALDHLAAGGLQVSDAELEARRSAVGFDDLATIVYTSGTTGSPKGCELTHRNLQFIITGAEEGVPEVLGVKTNTTIMFLPLAHIFGRVVQCLLIDQGLKFTHAPDAKNLVDDLAAFKPTFVLAVPRVFEKIFNAAQQKAQAEGKGKIFDRAARVCIAYSRATEQGSAPLGLRLQHALFDRLVYGKIRARLGGQMIWAISGGAALGERLGHFYRGIGLRVLEGYGLTETTAPLSINRPSRGRIGSVGPAMPGVSLRIADDGEILGRGEGIFRGYWGNPAATAAAIDSDGWFHTGDIGRIDDQGFLFITGRKKELLVTANGKNVAPAPLEDRIRSHALVSQCMVIGDGRPFVAALITLDAEALGPWARAHGLPEDLTPEQARSNADVLADIQQAVDAANRSVSQAESIRQIRVLATDWTEAGGQLTPSLKVKRKVVMAECAGDVAAIYGE